MTILIGARLDDGKKLLIADGNVYRGDNELVTSRAKKVRSVAVAYRQRKALFGVSGDRGALDILESVVEAYLSSPAPAPVDLGYRLMERVKALGVEWESNALVWVPNSTDSDYCLVSIDGIMAAHVIDHQHFWAEGSGRVHALGAYLGLVMHTTCAPLHQIAEKLAHFRPSADLVQTCFDVAERNDAHCGGEQTNLVIS